MTYWYVKGAWAETFSGRPHAFEWACQSVGFCRATRVKTSLPRLRRTRKTGLIHPLSKVWEVTVKCLSLKGETHKETTCSCVFPPMFFLLGIELEIVYFNGERLKSKQSHSFSYVFVHFFPPLFTVCYRPFKYHRECFRKVSRSMGQKAASAKL